DGALEGAVRALAPSLRLVLALLVLLPAERQHVVVHLDLEVLLLEARQLGRHADLRLRVLDVDARRERTPLRHLRGLPDATAPEVLEQMVHLALEREERILPAVRQRTRGAIPPEQARQLHLAPPSFFSSPVITTHGAVNGPSARRAGSRGGTPAATTT